MKTVNYYGELIQIAETDQEIRDRLLRVGFINVFTKDKEFTIKTLSNNDKGYEMFHFGDAAYIHVIQRPLGIAIEEEL